MREMSLEMAALLKSKTMIGDNRPTHEVVLGGNIIGENLFSNPRVIRGKDEGERDESNPSSATSFYGVGFGGGDFVTRVDGKILVTYFKYPSVMLSVVDSEEILLTGDNVTVESEWEFLSLSNNSAYSGALSYSSLVKLRNGDILLFITSAVEKLDDRCAVDCYVSNNGLGTDFIYLSTLYEYINSINANSRHPRVGKPIQLKTGRILISYDKIYPYSGYLWSDFVIAYSDDNGVTWNEVLPNKNEKLKGWNFGVCDDGTIRQIWMAVSASHGSGATRFLVSLDDGVSWDWPLKRPTIESSLEGLYSQISSGGGYIYFLLNNDILYRRKSTELIPLNDRYNIDLWEGPIYDSLTDDGYEIFFISEKGTLIYIGTSHYAGGSLSYIKGGKYNELKLQAKSISINRTSGMSSGLNISFDNISGILAPDGIENPKLLWPNKEIIIKQGYGQELIQTYKGLIDSVDMINDSQQAEITVSARDSLKRALDQMVRSVIGEFVVTFEGMAVEAIWTALAQRAGLIIGTVEETGLTLAEKTFSWETYGDAFSWLDELVGFETVCDEEGVVHFRKDGRPEVVTVAYTFEEGVDIIQLGYEINDQDIYKSVVVYGKRIVDEVEEVIVTSRYVEFSDYYNILDDKILKIDAPDADTYEKLEIIADKVIYLMRTRARIVKFKSIGIPHLQRGDFIQVTESSTTISEIYRITDITTTQTSESYTMDITCYHHAAPEEV